MIRQYELVERVKSYEPSADEALLNRAYVFSMKAHGTQTRASGDPYFAHPIEVAGILTELKLDSTSIATALLHDTVEDTVATIEEINDLFGEDTARLVDGVTKLSRLELQSDQAHQAENLRKFLLALSEDIRVLLVKLADRLHNMRTLHYVPDEKKRQRIAKETMEIYAPLAERIGLQAFKAELEDLAFKELNPDGFHTMETRLKALREEAGGMVERVTESLTGTLRNHRLRAAVSGREKRPYSIWEKMQRKKLAFEQLTDIVGFRVVIDSEEDCYRALGIVHRTYPMVPGRFKDYISTPKPNGYRSLHTAVIGPEQRRIEIQIRTRDMHEEAEYGVAAHWLFKQAGDVHDDRQQRWLRPLLEILDKASGPEELLEHAKLEMFQDEVFCFSPRGALITLPRGATPVDFAYAVHTDVGDTTVGAKVNGRMVPLWTQLENGDQVEILRSSVPQPQPAWESFVVTGKARDLHPPLHPAQGAGAVHHPRPGRRREALPRGRRGLFGDAAGGRSLPPQAALRGRSSGGARARRPHQRRGRGSPLPRPQSPGHRPARALGRARPARHQGRRHRHSRARADPGHGRAPRRVLQPAARRAHRRHRHHRQGRDDPHHRLRHAGRASATRPSAGSTSPGRRTRTRRASTSAASTWWSPTRPAASAS